MFFFSIAARKIATLPFIPGHECVGEVALKVYLTPKYFFLLKQIFAPVGNAVYLFELNLDFFIGCKSYEI